MLEPRRRIICLLTGTSVRCGWPGPGHICCSGPHSSCGTTTLLLLAMTDCGKDTILWLFELFPKCSFIAVLFWIKLNWNDFRKVWKQFLFEHLKGKWLLFSLNCRNLTCQMYVTTRKHSSRMCTADLKPLLDISTGGGRVHLPPGYLTPWDTYPFSIPAP